MSDLKIKFAPVSETSPESNAVKFVLVNEADLERVAQIIEEVSAEMDSLVASLNEGKKLEPIRVSSSVRSDRKEIKVFTNANYEYKETVGLAKRVSEVLAREEIPFHLKMYGWQDHFSKRAAYPEPVWRSDDWGQFMPIGQNAEGKFLYAVHKGHPIEFPVLKADW